ncbi:hypothetical protein ACFE04_004112 [Oxalis oulophora]
MRFIRSIVKRLKDVDSGFKEACQSTSGALVGRYLRKESGSDVFGLLVKPLFETMGKQNKGMQAGAALCMMKVVECSEEGERTSIIEYYAIKKKYDEGSRSCFGP